MKFHPSLHKFFWRPWCMHQRIQSGERIRWQNVLPTNETGSLLENVDNVAGATCFKSKRIKEGQSSSKSRGEWQGAIVHNTLLLSLTGSKSYNTSQKHTGGPVTWRASKLGYKGAVLKQKSNLISRHKSIGMHRQGRFTLTCDSTC